MSGYPERKDQIAEWVIPSTSDLFNEHGNQDGNRPPDIPSMILNQLTLETKLKIFVLLFSIIVVPATIVFIICYLKDRREQKKYELQMASLLNDIPDESLSYRERLSRPVPGSVPNNTDGDSRSEAMVSKSRKVSFANDELVRNVDAESLSSSKRPSVIIDVYEDSLGAIGDSERPAEDKDNGDEIR